MPTPSAFRQRFALQFGCQLLISLICIGSARADEFKLVNRPTPLDEYVAAPDTSYAWKVVHHQREEACQTFVLELTSQRWRSADQVDRTTWKHALIVYKPDSVASDKSLLFVSGGRNNRALPETGREDMRQIAVATRSVVAELGMVPNQPLVFHADGQQRYEDDLLGYGWDQYLQSGDPRWIPQLAMVKSAVRAMDAVQEFMASDQGGQIKIRKFVVSGASKRGWTTWLTAAVDARVCAIIPIVIDVLNIRPSMDHHYAAYGFWAPAIDDYVEHKITHRRNSPEYARLLKIVDPYFYRARLTMPKLLINATGDEFFLPDSSQFYFDQLVGDKHLCYVPNASHSLSGTRAKDSLLAFYDAVIHDRPRPKIDWSYPSPNKLRVRSSVQPRLVRLWSATNTESRDFRVDTIGRNYRSREIQEDAEGAYVAAVERPAKGWTAYFVQLEFDTGGPVPLRLTTPVRVIPDTLPFADRQAPELK